MRMIIGIVARMTKPLSNFNMSQFLVIAIYTPKNAIKHENTTALKNIDAMKGVVTNNFVQKKAMILAVTKEQYHMRNGDIINFISYNKMSYRRKSDRDVEFQVEILSVQMEHLNKRLDLLEKSLGYMEKSLRSEMNMEKNKAKAPILPMPSSSISEVSSTDEESSVDMNKTKLLRRVN